MKTIQFIAQDSRAKISPKLRFSDAFDAPNEKSDFFNALPGRGKMYRVCEVRRDGDSFVAVCSPTCDSVSSVGRVFNSTATVIVGRDGRFEVGEVVPGTQAESDPAIAAVEKFIDEGDAIERPEWAG